MSRSIVDTAVEIVSSLDWITPAISCVKCMSGSWEPISVFWNDQPPVHWERLLKNAGVKVTPGGIHPDGFILLVTFEDEFKARHILQTAGAPLA